MTLRLQPAVQQKLATHNTRLKKIPDRVGNLTLSHVPEKKLAKPSALAALKQVAQKHLKFITKELKK